MQDTMSCSTLEAKYHALASTTIELLWFIHLLKNTDYLISTSILYCDNINIINMTKNHIYHHHKKHIEIDVHFVREQAARGNLSLQHIFGPDRIADIFTKSLYAAKFLPNKSKLLTIPVSPRA